MQIPVRLGSHRDLLKLCWQPTAHRPVRQRPLTSLSGEGMVFDLSHNCSNGALLGLSLGGASHATRTERSDNY